MILHYVASLLPSREKVVLHKVGDVSDQSANASAAGEASHPRKTE